MYVLPFSMGDLKSPFAKIAVQVTDSSFVAANMRIMTRLGKEVCITKSTSERKPLKRKTE